MSGSQPKHWRGVPVAGDHNPLIIILRLADTVQLILHPLLGLIKLDLTRRSILDTRYGGLDHRHD
jgi:hypothetical protein